MTTQQRIIKTKSGCSSQTARERRGRVPHHGVDPRASIDSLAIRQGGEVALQETSRRRPNHKSRVELRIEEATVATAIQQPAWGTCGSPMSLPNRASPFHRAASASSGYAATSRPCLKALEEKVVQEGVLLTEPQLAAFTANSA